MPYSLLLMHLLTFLSLRETMTFSFSFFLFSVERHLVVLFPRRVRWKSRTRNVDQCSSIYYHLRKILNKEAKNKNLLSAAELGTRHANNSFFFLVCLCDSHRELVFFLSCNTI